MRVAIVIGFVASLAAREAAACLIELRCDPVVAPVGPATIPANSPVLFAYDSRLGGTVTITSPSGTITNLESSGSEPMLVGAQDLGAPLAEGDSWSLAVSDACSGLELSSTVIVGAAATLPTQIGAITSGTPNTNRHQVGASFGWDDCGGSPHPPYWITDISVPVSLAVDAELEPWRALASWSITDVETGRTVLSGAQFPADEGGGPTSLGTLTARCGSAVGSMLAPGRHAMKLTVHVPGASADPDPVTFDVDFPCDEVAPLAGCGCGTFDAGLFVLAGLLFVPRRKR